MLSLTTFADELEREKVRQRTRNAFLRKARSGHVCGGYVFGYDQAPVMITGSDGQSHRSHVARSINDAEAAVIRRIFELKVEGCGTTRIAKLLNAERAPSPKPKRGTPRGWAPSSVHAVLRRPLYRGQIV